MKKDNLTDFGFSKIPRQEKADRVGHIFQSVANRYDLMNDVMSFGFHRLWKKFTLSAANVHPGQHVLDIAGGTGDLAIALSKKVGEKGVVILADINDAMLKIGRDKCIDAGIFNNSRFVQANAEFLPFQDNTFDCITIGFGLRNVTDKTAALKSMYRVLKPGGKLLVLEFSKPALPLLEKLYDTYSFRVIPTLGQWITGDKESYQYLVESIRMHPDQESLKECMESCDFNDVHYHNLTQGIVALHTGWKY